MQVLLYKSQPVHKKGKNSFLISWGLLDSAAVCHDWFSCSLCSCESLREPHKIRRSEEKTNRGSLKHQEVTLLSGSSSSGAWLFLSK